MQIPKTSRPFYSEFAWAFDLAIDRPVVRECRTIATWLVERGVVPGATLLDAGCGTGRYAVELGRRGYVVHGIDSSASLLEEAKRAAGPHSPQVSFAVGDILTLSDLGSLKLNDQWRLILEIEGEGDSKSIVIVSIEDYH